MPAEALVTPTLPSRPHPLVLVAAASVTVLSLAGIAAIGNSQGWFGGGSTPAASAGAAPPASVPVTAPPAPISVQQTVTLPPARTDVTPATKTGSSGTAPRPAAKPSAPVAAATLPAPATVYAPPAAAVSPSTAACRDCGTVEAINEIEAEGKAGPAGAIIGGVVGAVVGNQIGHGTGRDVARVLGAAGGAYAGHQIEKSNSKTVRFETVIRFEDGATQRIVSDARPAWRAGDPVRLMNGELVSRR